MSCRKALPYLAIPTFFVCLAFAGLVAAAQGQQDAANRPSLPANSDAGIDRIIRRSDSVLDPHQPAIPVDRLNQIGILLYKTNRYTDSLRIFEHTLESFTGQGDLKGEATALNEIAMCEDMLGHKQLALESLENALAIWRRLGDHDNEISTLGKEGDLFRTWSFPDRALQAYKQAASLFPLSRDSGIQAGVENNAGLAYLDMHNGKKALRNFQAALDLYRVINDLGAQAITMINLGSTYNQAHETSKALEAFRHALDMARDLNDKELEAGSLNGMGQAYARAGDRGRALASFNDALAAFEKVGNSAGDAAVQKNISLLLPVGRR